jgi:hypothetical protein
MNLEKAVGAVGASDLLATLLFLGLAGFLYAIARELILKPAPSK